MMEVRRLLSSSLAIALATFLVIGTSHADSPAANVPIPQQIENIDKMIEMMEKMREAQEVTNQINELLGEATPAEREIILGDLQAFLANVKDNLRTTDLLAAGLKGEYGDDTSGIGFMMRRLYGLAKYFDNYQEIFAVSRHAGPNAPSTFISQYVGATGKVFEALSGVDAALQLIVSAVNEDQLTGGEALTNLGNMLSSLEDAMGLLGVAVNPVLTAMISLYATALVNAGWVADNVLAPAVEEKNGAIDLWDRVMTGTPEGQGGTGVVDDGQDKLDAIDSALYELRHSRDQLVAANDTDYAGARQNCIRNINNQLQTAAEGSTTQGYDVDGDGTFDDSDALHLVDNTLNARAQLDRDTRELSRQSAIRSAREAGVRRARANVELYEESLATAQANGDLAGIQRNHTRLTAARTDLGVAEAMLAEVPEDVAELEASIKDAYERYSASSEQAKAYKDCIRTLLEIHAPKTLEERDDSYVPEWIKNCTVFDLPASTLRVLGDLDLRTSMAPGSSFGMGSSNTMNASYSPVMGAFQVATDSPLWCTYGDGQGQSMTPVGPGGTGNPGQTPEGTPTDGAPADGAPTDDTGGGSPTDSSGGGTPTSGSPTDSGGGGQPASGMGTPTFSFPGSDTTADDTTDGEDDTTDGQTTDEPTASETPDDTTTTDEPATDDPQTPSSPPGVVRITFKVTKQVLLANGQVAQQPGGENRRVKLFSPDTQDPELPVAGSDRNDTGFEEDPIQCTTNTLGECTMPVSFNPSMVSTPYASGTNDSETPEFEVDIPVNEVSAANVTLDSGAALPADLAQYVVGNWAIGNQTTYSLAFQAGTDFQTMLDGFVKGGWQIDLCRDEQPAPPIGSLPSDYADPTSELPRSSVSFDFATEVHNED